MEFTLDSTLIHLRGKYKYSENIDASAAIDIVVHNAEPTEVRSTLPEHKSAEVEISQTNVAFGIGFNKDKYKFGLEMNYNMFDVTYTGYYVDTWIPYVPYKGIEMSIAAKLLVLKVGTEYAATDKVTLRAGAIKYAPLSATMESTDYWTDGTIGYVGEQTYDKLNTGNIILASIGVEYKVSDRMFLEYGYLGGKYLYNQNTLALVTDLGAYGGALATGSSILTPMSITSHRFSVKYLF